VTDLTEGTLADLFTVGSAPPDLRRQSTLPLIFPAPAAGAQFTNPWGDSFWHRVLVASFTLTTSSQAGLRYPAIAYTNGDGTVFWTGTTGAGAGPSSVTQVYGSIQSESVAAPQQTCGVGSTTWTATNSGTVTLPAGAALTGWDLVVGNASASATVTLTITGTISGTLTYNVADPTSAVPLHSHSYAFPVPAASPTTQITLTFNGTASTGSGSLNADYVTGPGYPGDMWLTLPDVTMKSAWQANTAITGLQSLDQVSNVVLVAERYASNYASGALTADEELVVRTLRRLLTRGL
jgi:hypothetical protein